MKGAQHGSFYHKFKTQLYTTLMYAIITAVVCCWASVWEQLIGCAWTISSSDKFATSTNHNLSSMSASCLCLSAWSLFEGFLFRSACGTQTDSPLLIHVSAYMTLVSWATQSFSLKKWIVSQSVVFLLWLAEHSTDAVNEKMHSRMRQRELQLAGLD